MIRLRLALGFASLVALGACTKGKLVGQGGECELASDCEEGLICIPQKDGRRLCSSDLSQVQAPPEVADASKPDAPPSDAQAAADATSQPTDSGTGSPVPDSAPAHDAAPTD